MTDVFVCECGSIDHTFQFYWDESDKSLIINIRLISYKRFWQRLSRAIGYVFNIGKRKGKIYHFGDYDSILIKPEDAEKLIKYLKLASLNK